MATILCVDDETAVGEMLEYTLKRLGHHAVLASDVEHALTLAGSMPVDLLIADYRMPKLTGLDLLRLLESEGLRIPTIIMTGYSSIEHAVVSIRSGAIDYLTKPVRPESLELAVSHALEFARLRRENEVFRQEILDLRRSRTIVGESAALRRTMDLISAVAPTRSTVLLHGETGTGKELFARALHDHSPRHDGPFVTMNCAALPDGLIESMLFGHEKGAFTGATVRTAGAFERAHSGTLLLDEVSEMRLDLQAKLLRVIQEREFERVGGTRTMRVDVRLIATSNRDLKAEVEAGRFRSDLYYRLSVVPIRAPALRERIEDIPLLVHHFIQRSAAQLGVPAPSVDPAALRGLEAYSWPGNIRELSNAVERAVVLSRGGTLTADSFIDHLGTPHISPDVKCPVIEPVRAPAVPVAIHPDPVNLDELERGAIQRALASTGGNRTRREAPWHQRANPPLQTEPRPTPDLSDRRAPGPRFRPRQVSPILSATPAELAWRPQFLTPRAQ